ncbi:unnamed protein product [Closterium sp. NIES-53]
MYVMASITGEDMDGRISKICDCDCPCSCTFNGAPLAALAAAAAAAAAASTPASERPPRGRAAASCRSCWLRSWEKLDASAALAAADGGGGGRGGRGRRSGGRGACACMWQAVLEGCPWRSGPRASAAGSTGYEGAAARAAESGVAAVCCSMIHRVMLFPELLGY